MMAPKRGRPRGAQSGTRAKPYHAAWGTPNTLHEQSYPTESQAKDRLTGELKTMLAWGDKFSPTMVAGCSVALTEIRDSTFLTSVKSWTAVDDLTGVTFVVKMWRD